MFNRWSPGLRHDQVRARKRLQDEGLHEEMEERFRKTLYYGELPEDEECPSLPLTNLAVEFFQDATPRGLGQVNMYMASSFTTDACVSPGSLMTSMIYAKRLRQRNPDYLQKMSSSDLFFISVMMASKYMYDEGVDEEVFNDEWADSGNMEVEDVNQLERDFLSAMDWQLFVSQDEFLKTVEETERRIAWSQGCSRGWLSYTDMDLLWDDPRMRDIWDQVAKEWFKIITVSSAAYIAGVLTMVGSTALALQLSSGIAGYAILSQPKPQFDQPIIAPEPTFDQPSISGESSLDTMLPEVGFKGPVRLPNLPAATVDGPGSVNNSHHAQGTDSDIDLMRNGNLLERVLPQLWAVIAFKDKFVHMICAFSESLRQRSSKHVPRKCTSCSKTPTSRDPNPHGMLSEPDVESDRLNHPENRNGKCPSCPHCNPNRQDQNLNSCPVQKMTNDLSDEVMDQDHLKKNLNFDPWCCHGNRPPDSQHLVLDLLRYPDIIRGFATGAPVAA